MSERITLNRGDLVRWEPSPGEAVLGSTMRVLATERGLELWFTYANKPFEDMEFFWPVPPRPGGPLNRKFRGLTVAEVEAVLNREVEWGGPGYVYKAYDAETGATYADPVNPGR